MKFLTLFLLAVAAFAQTPVNPSSGPPPNPIVLKPFDASASLQYLCYADQRGPTTSVRKSDTTLTNIVVSSNTATVTTPSANGAWEGMRVTVSGATVDTDLNATYTVLTVTGYTTYTFTTVNVGNATYTDATLVITTSNPLLTAARWAILVLRTVSDSTIPIVYWANSSIGYGLACSDRATY